MVTNIPIIRFFEWDIDEVSSPIGIRHIAGASFAFKQMIASGCQHSDPLNLATTSGTLAFEGTKFDLTGNPSSHLASKVSVMTVNLGSSGVAITEMKLFLRDDSALRASMDRGLDPVVLQMAVSGVWQPNAVLPSGITGRLTTDIPAFPNLRRQDGIHLSLEKEDDGHSSQFVYLNLIIPFGHPLGSFGVCGSGALRFGLMFNYYPV